MANGEGTGAQAVDDGAAPIEVKRHETDPIVYLIWPARFGEVQTTRAMLALFSELQRLPRVVVISDELAAPRANHPSIKRMFDSIDDFTRARHAFLHERLAGWADVIGNPFLRSVAHSRATSTPRPFPTEIFESTKRAENWARTRLAERAR